MYGEADVGVYSGGRGGEEGEARKTEVRGRVRVRVPRRIASKMAARNANLDR